MCSIEVESHCTGSSCMAPLRCEDDQCRTECLDDGDCRTGHCVRATCVEPPAGVDGGPAQDDGGTDAAQIAVDGGSDGGPDAGSDAGMDVGSAGGTDGGSDGGTDGGLDAGRDANCSGCSLSGTSCALGTTSGACGYGNHVCSTCASCSASGVCDGGESCGDAFDVSAIGTTVLAVDTCVHTDDITAPAHCADSSAGPPSGTPDVVLRGALTSGSVYDIHTDPPSFTIIGLNGTPPCVAPPSDFNCSNAGSFSSTGGSPGATAWFAIERAGGGCGRVTITVDHPM